MRTTCSETLDVQYPPYQATTPDLATRSGDTTTRGTMLRPVHRWATRLAPEVSIPSTASAAARHLASRNRFGLAGLPATSQE